MTRMDIHVHAHGPIYIDGGSATKFERVLAKLDALHAQLDTGVTQIMATEADLDAALTQLSADLDAAVVRIEAKIAGSGIDLTDELATVSGLSARVASVATDVVVEEPPA